MTDIADKHDDMLFELLKETKTIPNFFNAIFGFLHRRTDFYYIAENTDSVVGLPEGLSEKIVQHAFYKWKTIPSTTLISADDIPITSECEIIGYEEEEEVVASEPTLEITPPAIEELQICEKPDAEYKFNKSESYNGSVFETYCWSQTISDIDVVVKLPADITKKDLNIEITPSQLNVKVKDTFLIEGELCQKCKANDAIWSMDGRKLQIHLDKCQEMWWNCLVKGEAELDVSNIDCTRPYEDLSDEAQAKIEELQWNQERKRLGLPTSDDLMLQKTLKKAWNAKGSPFSGPFDPSVVSFN